MNRELKRYVKERDEMLRKVSVPELRKFIKEHAMYFEPAFAENINNASDEVLKITLHKMIVNVTSMPKELRETSAWWLRLHGFSVDV